MITITKISEIDKPGQYQDRFGNKVTIDTELDRNDNIVYCIAVNWQFIMNGWKLRKWKTLDNAKRFISSEIAALNEPFDIFNASKRTIEPDV